jgi:hypothetical protein
VCLAVPGNTRRTVVLPVSPVVLAPTLDPKPARAPLAPLAPFQRQKAVLLVPCVPLDRACGVSCAMLVA